MENKNVQNTANVDLPEQLIPEDSRKALKEHFATLSKKVKLHIYADREAKDAFSRFVFKLIEELFQIGDNISVAEHGSNMDELEIKVLPQIAIQGEGSPAPVLTMVGAPLGEEGRVLIQAIMLAGGVDDGGVSKEAKDILAGLKEKRSIKVFGSGTCPYCPGQMSIAAGFAAERPELISAYAIAADQYPALSKHYSVGGVPHTVLNETNAVVGLMPDAPFASFVVSLKKESLGQYAENAVNGAKDGGGYQPQTDELFGPGATPSGTATLEAAMHGFSQKNAKGDEFKPDLLILGGGPAGLMAAVYGARAGLDVTLLDQGMLGGQVALTPVVENFPGAKEITGSKLAGSFIAQAEDYAHLRGNMQITNLEHKDGKFIAHTSNGLYSAKAIIFATGASWRKLNIPGEAVYSGRGVHNCASCDGFMYIGKKVHVIGGGNTALTDALHLANLGIDVTVVHRRDQFRGEKALANAIHHHDSIEVIWNHTAKEIMGDNDKVTGIRLVNIHNNEEQLMDTDGVFVSVGQDPNSRPAMAVRAEITEGRYIKVDDKMRTTVPRAYAAGDVTGGFQQIVTATATGALSANTAFEDLQH